MKKRYFLIITFFFAFTGMPAAATGSLPIIKDVNAVCKNGQVFITWKESPENQQNISVYMSPERVTPSTIGKAVLLTDEIGPLSGRDWTLDPSMCPRAQGPKQGWIIEEGALPLTLNSGLFVHTVTETDPKNAFFAVIRANGNISEIKAGVNSLEEPVELFQDDIEAIPQLNQIGTIKKNMPLALYLHPHTSRPPGELTHLFFGDKTMGWREGLPFKFKVSVLDDVVLVEPYDRVWINRLPGADETSQSYDRKYKHIESWWYGTFDNIHKPEGYKTGTPVNYTERILAWIIKWVQKKYDTDPERTYGFGLSMGTGIQRFALEKPEMFASVDVLVPLLDLEYEIEIEKDNIKRKIAAFGDLDRICSDGMPLSERFDLVDHVCSAKQDLPFIVIRVGRQDTSVGWKRKVDYISCMQKQKHGLLAGWDNGDHVTAMRKSVDEFPDFRDYRWHIEHFATNRSYPAFTNYTEDDNFGSGLRNNGDLRGFTNLGLDWILKKDEPDVYQIVVKNRQTKKAQAKVDVTLRRRQKFIPTPGSVVIAANQVFGGDLLEKKDIIVDNTGNITYENFQLTKGMKNVLTLRRRY